MRPPSSILLLLLPLITITASASLHSSNSLKKRHLHDHSHPPHRDVLKRLGSVNDAQVQEKDAEKDWSLGGVLGMVEEGLMELKEKRQLLGSPDDDEVTTTSSTTSRAAVATSRTTSTPPLTSSTPPTTSSPTSSSTTSSSSIRGNTDTSQSNSQGSSSTGQTSNTAATGSGSISTSASGSTTGSPSGSQVIPSGASNTSSIVSQSQAPATHTSTDAQGSIIYITQIETLSASSTNDHIGTSIATVLATDAAGANTNGTSTGNSNGGGGMSTGAIVGISVVGGVAVLGIVLFVVWKMKQKRFSGFDDDDVDGIKWPELNKHGESDMHLPLPAKPTGNHGFETDALDRSKTDLDGNRIDGDDDYEPYSGSQPISYANSINGHYPEEQQQYNMGYASTGVYGPDSTNLSRAPSVAATYLSGNDASTVGLDRSRSLGGTRAFDVEPDAEMMEMTGQKPAADMSRDGSNRLH